MGSGEEGSGGKVEGSEEKEERSGGKGREVGKYTPLSTPSVILKNVSTIFIKASVVIQTECILTTVPERVR